MTDAPARRRRTAPAKPAATKPAAPRKPAATEKPAPTADRGLALYFLRHADAGDSAAWTGDDAARPLSKKGRKDSRRLGKHLAAIGVEAQVILTSPRVRAADTARLVGKALGIKPSIDPRVDSGFDRAALQAVVAGLDPSVTGAILVGHDPDFSSLASWLSDSTIEMRKGAVARLELSGRSVGAGAGALRWLVPPDALRG